MHVPHRFAGIGGWPGTGGRESAMVRSQLGTRIALRNRGQPTGLTIGAGFARRPQAVAIVGVVAQVGCDEDIVRRGLEAFQIRSQLLQVDYICGAARGIDDRMEIHERVVPCGIAVAHQGRVARVEGPVALGRPGQPRLPWGRARTHCARGGRDGARPWNPRPVRRLAGGVGGGPSGRCRRDPGPYRASRTVLSTVASP